MNENAVRGRASEIAEAEQTINVLSGELLKHKANADRWMINFDVNLVQDQDGQYMVEIAGKAGPHGNRITLTAADVAEFADDPDTVARNIADVMLKAILGDVVREELVPQIVRAIKNANKIKRSAL